MSDKPKGLQRLMLACGYSWDGLRATFRTEAAFRQELALCAVLVPLALWLDVSGVERALLIGSLLLVLMMEIINSAIEAVVDYISAERHPLAKKAKDCGSAAVLIALLNAALIWAAITL
jgi:diacylglycerol kinase (ATP)